MTSSLAPLPWHVDALDAVLRESNRLAHAVLVSAPVGTGALEFAHSLAAALLCEARVAPSLAASADSNPAHACGVCAACGWILAGNHPDLRFVGVEAEAPVEDAERGKPQRLKPEIRIDAVRALSTFAATGSRRGGRRIIVLGPAESLNLSAANATLKTLEEPTPGLIWLLATEHPGQILATVRSRCVPVLLQAPSSTLALNWLESVTQLPTEAAQRVLDAGGGAPLRALEEAQPHRGEAIRAAQAAIGSLPQAPLLEVAQRLEGIEPQVWMAVLQRWVSDLARVASGVSPRFRSHEYRQLEALARASSGSALTQCAADLIPFRRQVDHPLNPRLFAEATLRVYAKAFEPRAR